MTNQEGEALIAMIRALIAQSPASATPLTELTLVSDDEPFVDEGEAERKRNEIARAQGSTAVTILRSSDPLENDREIVTTPRE